MRRRPAPAPARAPELAPEPDDTVYDDGYDEVYTEEFGEPLEEMQSPARTIVGWVATIALAIVLSLVIRSFVAHAFHVESGSMLPTLEPGDRILVSKLSDNPSRGEVVVFERPNGDLVKRVVALEGETVYFDEGLLKIDDKWLEEPYLAAGTGTYAPSAAIPNCETPDGSDERSACTVPEGHVFVMGDNRLVSFDSRNFGPVARDDIIGTTAFQFWPLGDLRGL